MHLNKRLRSTDVIDGVNKCLFNSEREVTSLKTMMVGFEA